MSYSRWSNSRWYTYWSCSGGLSEREEQAHTWRENRAQQVFEICTEGHFTYAELTKHRQECLQKILDRTECSVVELKELSGYMDSFVNDVDIEYNPDRAAEKQQRKEELKKWAKGLKAAVAKAKKENPSWGKLKRRKLEEM